MTANPGQRPTNFDMRGTHVVPGDSHASERGSALAGYLAGAGCVLAGAVLCYGPIHDAMARQEGQRVAADTIGAIASPTPDDIRHAQQAGEAAAADYSFGEYSLDMFLRNRNKWQLFLDVQIRNPETGEHDSRNTQANVAALLAFLGYGVMGWNKDPAKQEAHERALEKENSKLYKPTTRRHTRSQSATPAKKVEKREQMYEDPLITPGQEFAIRDLAKRLADSDRDDTSTYTIPSVKFSSNGQEYTLYDYDEEYGRRITLTRCPQRRKFVDKQRGYIITLPREVDSPGVTETYTLFREAVPGKNLPVIGSEIATSDKAKDIISVLEEGLRQNKKD